MIFILIFPLIPYYFVYIDYYILCYICTNVIIYVTYHTYNAYIKGEFPNNKLWIRDIKFIPRLEEDDRWVIWQVSNRGRVRGIPGFTDKNVLRIDSVEQLIEENRIKE